MVLRNRNKGERMAFTEEEKKAIMQERAKAMYEEMDGQGLQSEQ